MTREMDREHEPDCPLDTTFTRWRTSSRTRPPNNDCVEVGFSSNAAGVRDSKNRSGPTLAFGRVVWEAFLDNVNAGTFAPPERQ
ncbi:MULTISPECIES: DUF397 domain-containing protein [unclassified Crossiella]|uniref:DUF397 domain-containing protein n=1 Tax=unclassified Crossiella TaxID=2620835 RepID=UPI001FFE7DAE|nr:MULTISPECIES: DUF397 domain-containing protein [unclassified Crossiella]MCK2237415.1 DUF397 domain-containing protein [Crossiella sp. S99.2]MCK2251070.1 DUF397 domain-containing protein [Crossiella sp. S99.1]